MLFWIWFSVAVLLGIDIGAEILGVGPQAYIGGLITGAAIIWAYKSWPERRFDDKETEFVSGSEQDHPPPIPSDFRGVAVAHARTSNAAEMTTSGVENREKSSRRRSSRSTEPPPTFLDRIKRFLQRVALNTRS
jgi:hypothetical protein